MVLDALFNLKREPRILPLFSPLTYIGLVLYKCNINVPWSLDSSSSCSSAAGNIMLHFFQKYHSAAGENMKAKQFLGRSPWSLGGEKPCLPLQGVIRSRAEIT